LISAKRVAGALDFTSSLRAVVAFCTACMVLTVV
jgi:hypothetical protein